MYWETSEYRARSFCYMHFAACTKHRRRNFFFSKNKTKQKKTRKQHFNNVVGANDIPLTLTLFRLFLFSLLFLINMFNMYFIRSCLFPFYSALLPKKKFSSMSFCISAKSTRRQIRNSTAELTLYVGKCCGLPTKCIIYILTMLFSRPTVFRCIVLEQKPLTTCRKVKQWNQIMILMAPRWITTPT